MAEAPRDHPRFENLLARAERATDADPLPILFSACILGNPTGYDGSAWPVPAVQALAALPNVRAEVFCPEAHVLPTPRPAMNIHGGDGHDVLAGRGRVIDIEGRDLTAEFLAAADVALQRSQLDGGDPRVAVMMDVSPSCGRNVVVLGEAEPERAYRAGQGVVAARLAASGVIVLAQRDTCSVALLRQALDGTPVGGDDFVEHPWYVEYFAG